ncbi:MAG: type II CRISPR RNA-guided endonuclease Cas9, partial [Clostridiaceae bacterium]|nr:type II CRISPR RNA-guided endonuclease Cas9 [Clostridiaceae bacterium]
KIREESDKHHALDAAVVAVTSRAMIQKIANFLSWKQFRKAGDMYVDEETGEVFYAKKIPQPWEGFSQELMARLSENPRENIRKLNLPSYSNEDLSFVRPIFVSRMPRRKVTGPAHEETVRRFEGYDEKGMIKTSKKISITELNYDKLEQMVGKESDPAVYNTLKQRLDEFDGNAKKAFASPVYKPKKDGSNGSQIKGIRIWEKPASGGVRINNGIADNGRMIRIDIFEKDKKYYIVPVYTKDVVKDGLPDKAIVPKKPESLWIQIDDSFSFKFSVYPNELIEITRKKGKEEETLFGYYIGCNRNDGSIEIEEHDSSKSYGSIGVRNLKTFKKYNVDILGNKNPIKGEKRIGFSQRNHNRTCNTEN